MKSTFIQGAAALLLLFSEAAQAQTPGQLFAGADDLREAAALRNMPKLYTQYRLYRLDVAGLQTRLAGAALEFSGGRPVEITLPMPHGGTQAFTVFESPTLSPALAAQNPGLKTYSAQAVGSPATARLAVLNGVFSAVLFDVAGSGEVYFQHVDVKGTPNVYFCYATSDVKPLPRTGPDAKKNVCGTLRGAGALSSGVAGPVRRSSGTTLRTYRLAVAATKEFTTAKGLPANANTQTAGLAGVVDYVNVLKGVYRKELSVDFTLVSGTNAITTTTDNPTTFNNTDTSVMLGQVQPFLDAQVGNAAYDVGHVLGYTAGSNSGGGVAVASSVCNDAVKGQGVTGVNEGEAIFPRVFGDQVFAHEMGHQFAMQHTFNSSIPVCTTRAADASVEPGSGTTIMSYGYTCASQTNPAENDDYATAGTAGALPLLNFHAKSLQEANAFITTTTCGTTAQTNAALPTLSGVSTGFTIPKSTPFSLTGTGSGGGTGSTLTYSWEGMNVGATPDAGTVLTTELADDTKAPFFRTYAPVSTGTRTFPLLAAILNGTNKAIGDKLPSVGSALQLRLTVRDGLGGVNESDATITVDGTSGPFLETTNLAGSYQSGTQQTITWSVNNTTAAPVSCATVNILLSTDGGLTFPYTLATATTNDGTEAIILPNITTATTQARVKIAAVNNVFFDISNADFSLTPAAAPAATLNTTALSGTSFCAGSALSVAYTATGTYTAGNVFTAQLSDDSGSFSAPAAIGTLSSTTSGSIAASLPAGLNGTGYRVRVVASAPATTGTDNGTSLSVNTTAAPTGAASQSFASGATVASLAATGTGIQWYAASTGGAPLAATTPLVNGTTYYASQTASGCESPGRLAVAATVAAPATVASVATTTVAALTDVSATLGGTVTADGGAAVTERGVVYSSTIATPTTADTKVTSGAGAGSFSLSVTGLNPSTAYNVRAYAINSVGTSYGTALTFTTLATPLATSAAALAAQVLAYPNPAHGRLTVLRPASATPSAELVNALGQVVRRFALPTAETVLDVRQLAPGVYALRLILNGQPVTKRLVIE